MVKFRRATRHLCRPADNCLEVRQNEIRIFEIGKCCEIEADPKREQRARAVRCASARPIVKFQAIETSSNGTKRQPERP